MYTEILILAILRQKPQHGYDIKKSVERVLGGTISLNNKVLYPALKRFEELGAIRREVEHHEGRPDRHVYYMTERGTEILHALLDEFTAEMARNPAEFLVRVAFFGQIEVERRVEILRLRMEVVAEDVAHLQAMRVLASDGDRYMLRTIDFQEQRHRSEYEWLQSLLEEELKD
jgi:DNA-binding PadR family transcriptional regulator